MCLWWSLCTLCIQACQVRVTIQRMCLWWSLCTLYLHACQVSHHTEDVPLLEFMYLVFTCMPGESHHTGESYHTRHRSLLLCLRFVFRSFTHGVIKPLSSSFSTSSFSTSSSSLCHGCWTDGCDSPVTGRGSGAAL